MPTPRNRLVDPHRPLCYHLVSSCVRGAHLCGFDKDSGRDYSHRKDWIVERLQQLVPAFPIELYSYAIMSNHLHLVVHYDPTVSATWSDEEVARRWIQASALEPDAFEELLADSERLKVVRQRLGSLSSFMQQLKQPIAWRANKEDGRRGHFFEQRFYSGALLGEASLLASMIYVDLNPVRANLAQTIEQCQHTTVKHRLQVLEHSVDRLSEYLEPELSGFESPASPSESLAPETTAEPVDPANLDDGDDHRDIQPRARAFSQPIRLHNYIVELRTIVAGERGKSPQADPINLEQTKPLRWAALVAALGRRQRAYGSREELKTWLDARHMRHIERPLPDG